MLAVLDTGETVGQPTTNPFFPIPFSVLSISTKELWEVPVVANARHVTQFWPRKLQWKFVGSFWRKPFAFFLQKRQSCFRFLSSFYFEHQCDGWSWSSHFVIMRTTNQHANEVVGWVWGPRKGPAGPAKKVLSFVQDRNQMQAEKVKAEFID